MTGDYSGGGFQIEGRPKPADWMDMATQYNIATPDYFPTLGIPILSGRDFDDLDTASAPAVAIIDQTLARQFFPGENPLGRRLKTDGWRTIVGVAGSVKHQQPMRPPRPQVYHPYAQSGGGAMWVTLRVAGNPADLMGATRGVVHSLEKDALVEKMRPMDRVVADSLNEQQWIMTVMTGYAGFALALAAIGLYGVIAYSVAQRTHEIGVRLVLGATRGHILRQVVGRGALLAGAGIAIGLPCALAVLQLLRSLLYVTTPHDWIVLVFVPFVLLVVALIASAVPARRAAGVDPLVALRQE
jgi:putative ABC transport system permease protein